MKESLVSLLLLFNRLLCAWAFITLPFTDAGALLNKWAWGVFLITLFLTFDFRESRRSNTSEGIFRGDVVP